MSLSSWTHGLRFMWRWWCLYVPVRLRSSVSRCCCCWWCCVWMSLQHKGCFKCKFTFENVLSFLLQTWHYIYRTFGKPLQFDCFLQTENDALPCMWSGFLLFGDISSGTDKARMSKQPVSLSFSTKLTSGRRLGWAGLQL